MVRVELTTPALRIRSSRCPSLSTDVARCVSARGYVNSEIPPTSLIFIVVHPIGYTMATKLDNNAYRGSKRDLRVFTPLVSVEI